jgi:hypothetical protein
MGDTPPQQTSPTLSFEQPTNTGDACKAECENVMYKTKRLERNRTLAAGQTIASKWQNYQKES